MSTAADIECVSIGVFNRYIGNGNVARTGIYIQAVFTTVAGDDVGQRRAVYALQDHLVGRESVGGTVSAGDSAGLSTID